MRNWLPIERRFLATLMETMLPGSRLGPVEGDRRFWSALEQTAPPLLRIGLRAAAWGIGSWLGLLSGGRRDRCLARLANSRAYLLRQLVLSVKLVVCFAYYSEVSNERARDRSAA